MSLPVVHLRPLRPHRYGHPWIFVEEIAKLSDPKPTDGSWIQIVDHNGKDRGIGYYNSHSKIPIRRVDDAVIPDGESHPSQDWWTQKIQSAFNYRTARGVVSRGFYRLIHAEADGIPGLIVDVYGQYVSVQFLTLGVDLQKELVVNAIENVMSPRGIYERSDVAVRKLEGLAEQTGLLSGSEPPDRITLPDGNAKIVVSIKHGGKTGLFLDQIKNHGSVAAEAKGRDVLNVFAYTGLFGLRAAAAGAKTVEDVESSEFFLKIAADQWQLNKEITSKCKYSQTHANAFDDLRKRETEGYLCDMVILDPPAFTKNRAGAGNAERGYNEINRRALKLLRPHGVLVTCSCTHHIDSATFIEIVAKAARDAKREIKLTERRGQGPDHPIIPGIPETEYLKLLIFAVS